MPFPIYVTIAQFGRSALKAVGINTREPQKVGRAGIPLSRDGRRERPHDTPPPTRVAMSNLAVL